LYNTPGQYLITLVATDGVCTDTTEQLVKVSIKPVVNFSADQTLTCDTARVQFTNLTTNGSNYEWNFGDGTLNNATNPFKSFPPRTAAYTVKLVASSTFGCKDSIVKPNLILAKVAPASDFFISPGPVITVPRYTFSFNNLTLNNSSYKYLWSLGDGTFATTRDVTRKYADTGNYAIRLIVLDTINNCSDTTTKIARIDGFPGYLYVPNAICPACIQSNLREFLPKGMGLKEYRLQIFTTWNELIFETRSLDSKGAPNQAWDGRFKGAVVQQDVYVWRIDAKYLNGTEWLGMSYPGDDKLKKAGTITVVK
jgi:PKD domain